MFLGEIMDEARCKELDRVVTSEELYIIENVKSLNFICDFCEIELLPCSFQKEVNLRKPYFKTRKGINHKQGCDAEGQASIRTKGATTRLTSSEGFPLSYPNRFKLRKDDVVDSKTIVDLASATKINKPSNNTNDNNSSKSRKTQFETTSFKSVVNQYFDFPFDRDRNLSFEGVDGNTYKDIFKKIVSTRGNQQFLIQGEEVKVYYASLPWKIGSENNDILKIELSPGRWVIKDEKKTNESPYYLQIDFNDWPKQTKTKFLNEYNKVINLVRGTDKKAAIAFVGKQDLDGDFFRFFPIDRRLIAFKIFNDA